MRYISLILGLCGSLYGQASGVWAAHMDSLVKIEWDWMSVANRAVVLKAYHWGDSLHDYRELGAHYAHESRGEMQAVRKESNGSTCAGPGQNDIGRCAEKTFGKDYTPADLRETQRRLCRELDYSFARSWDHIQIGLVLFPRRWNVYRWYNNIETDNHRYAAWIVAWTIFLDKLTERNPQ